MISTLDLNDLIILYLMVFAIGSALLTTLLVCAYLYLLKKGLPL